MLQINLWSYRFWKYTTKMAQNSTLSRAFKINKNTTKMFLSTT